MYLTFKCHKGQRVFRNSPRRRRQCTSGPSAFTLNKRTRATFEFARRVRRACARGRLHGKFFQYPLYIYIYEKKKRENRKNKGGKRKKMIKFRLPAKFSGAYARIKAFRFKRVTIYAIDYYQKFPSICYFQHATVYYTCTSIFYSIRV